MREKVRTEVKHRLVVIKERNYWNSREKVVIWIRKLSELCHGLLYGLLSSSLCDTMLVSNNQLTWSEENIKLLYLLFIRDRSSRNSKIPNLQRLSFNWEFREFIQELLLFYTNIPITYVFLHSLHYSMISHKINSSNIETINIF